MTIHDWRTLWTAIETSENKREQTRTKLKKQEQNMAKIVREKLKKKKKHAHNMAEN